MKVEDSGDHQAHLFSKFNVALNHPLGDDVEPPPPGEYREYICGQCWRDERSMNMYMRFTGYGGALFGMGPGWKPGDGSMFAAFNAWVDNQVAKAHQRQNIMRGITEALTSKDQRIFTVDPRTGAATLHTSEQQIKDCMEDLYKLISSQSGPVCASTNAGPSDTSPWDIVKGNSKLLLQMILHLPDAFSINGNINAIQLLGVDWTPDSRFLNGNKVSFLGMLTGPDRGKSKSFYEHPLAFGFDISAGITLGEYFYVPNGNQSLRLSNFQGERLSVSVGFGFLGFDGSVGLVYAPLESGYYIGIMRFVGAGDPGLSLNVNWGRTFFDD
ncbi:MAG: hypothetical protein HRU69_08210 [Flammeovirgaceae bacterium]|nr:MAG: hypothetical protein HRU69_08210 [Flammeovirgaceae bacterium]